MSVIFGYDVPDCQSGNIIGEIETTGAIFFAGKQQGQKFSAPTGKAVEQILRRRIEKLKSLCPDGYKGGQFEIRIYE